MTAPDHKWYLWPHGYIEGYIPWFKIMHRLIAFPIVLTALCFLFVAVWFGFGLSKAKETWWNIR